MATVSETPVFLTAGDLATLVAIAVPVPVANTVGLVFVPPTGLVMLDDTRLLAGLPLFPPELVPQCPPSKRLS
jgi:hypothetical protein